MKMKHVIGALVICMVAATAAQASTLYVRYMNVSSGNGVQIKDTTPDPDLVKDTTAGIYNLEYRITPSPDSVPTGSGNAGTPLTSFCVDVIDGSTTDWKIYTELSPLSSVFSATKAKDIGQLFTLAVLSPTGAWSSTFAGAIQACVWEIIRESPPTSTTTDYDLAIGNWTVTGLTSGNAGQASSWLTSLNNDNSSGDNLAEMADLTVLSNGTYQDFAIVKLPGVDPVPEPLTMASAFLAIAGLGGYIRRRTGRAAA